jgi:hypothetical protein
MTGGLLDYVFEAAEIVRESGVTFDDAMAIVHAKHEPEPESNVIRMADYVRQRAEKTTGAL